MNLADYLSELLGQHDEVSVPGLGYFVRLRVNAYYNDKEGRFYPPHHQVKFVPQLREDDDTFVQYVADKKNISLASSKYFAEKFIGKLREDAARGKYLFADLGLFYSDQDQLIFKPNEKIPADPAFYGYPEVSLDKIGRPLSPGDAKPVFTQTFPPPEQPLSHEENIEQQYFEEEPEHTRHLNVWLILLITLTVVVLALFGFYRFYPPAANKMNAAYHKILGKKEDTAVPVYRHEVKIDSAIETTTGKSTAEKTTTPVAPVIDTLKLLHFEVIASKVKKWQKARAEAEVTRFKSKGLDAKISTDAPGPLLKISVGTYFTLREADSVRKALVNSGKISWRSERPLQINPKK
jgi:hypothetical protein